MMAAVESSGVSLSSTMLDALRRIRSHLGMCPRSAQFIDVHRDGSRTESSAKVGLRTLRALERRGLVEMTREERRFRSRWQVGEGWYQQKCLFWRFELTDAGRAAVEGLREAAARRYVPEGLR